MALIDRYKKLADKYKNDPEYLLEGLMIDVTEQIVRQMENNEMTRTQLAQKLGCSNAYITKLLNGSGNLTLKKLLEISVALNCSIDFAFVTKEASVYRFFHLTTKRLSREGFNQPYELPNEYESRVPAAA